MSEPTDKPANEEPAALMSEDCQEHHDGCCNPSEPLHVHIHIHLHNKCCSPAPDEAVSSITPASRMAHASRSAPIKPLGADAALGLPAMKVGYSGTTLGDPGTAEFITQIKSSKNYGPNGKYNKIKSVVFSDATKDIVKPSQTPAQLKKKYSVISFGLDGTASTAVQAKLLKGYVALGGGLILTCDHKVTPGMVDFLNAFGHTGAITPSSVLLTAYSGQSSSTEKTSDYFGDAADVELNGAATLALTPKQLPANSRVLASTDKTILLWLLGDMDERVLVISDYELIKLNSSGISVNTKEEKFLHNLIAYLFDQVLKPSK
ncbi:hypothetical protein [Pseudomonas sp. B22129]|uniref:hypothetical protein n=1 Tax=Pseudomonas sp. B22129 TaxID=3235111 RepID=UPI003783B224